MALALSLLVFAFISVLAARRSPVIGVIASSHAGKFNGTATGGTITTPGDGFKYHTFTANGTFSVTSGSGNVEVLSVGGGASGGGSNGGGGGSGGINYNAHKYISTIGGDGAGNYAVTVGAGGAAVTVPTNRGNNGSDSVFADTTGPGNMTAKGGGYGNGPVAAPGDPGGNGGSGGGASTDGAADNIPGGSSTQTSNGGGVGTGGHGGAFLFTSPGSGSGGGGGASGLASGNGEDANTHGANTGGNGGAGKTFWDPATGAAKDYGGGGGGRGNSAGGSAGGSGGGGAGSVGASGSGTAGTANTGGGGGGGGAAGGDQSGAGGSGIVIVRYPL